MNAVLNTELETVIVGARKIADEFKGKDMPAEKRAEFDTLHKRGLEIKAKLTDENAYEEKQRDLDSLSDFQSRPRREAPLPIGRESEKDGVAVLAQRGWELKGGMWHAPTSLGLQPMYPNDVLFGDMPAQGSAEEVNYFGSTRAAMQPLYGKTWSKYLKLVGKTKDPAIAITRLEGFEQKALSEGSDTAGGNLVPPDYQAEMLVRKPAFSVVRKAGARTQPTTRDSIRFPMVNAAAATAGGLSSGGDSIFAGGFVGAWAGETPAFSDTDPTFTLFQIALKKLRVATKLGNDFLADAAVDVAAWLARNGAENMALVEDLGFINGNGAALQPKGILQTAITVVNIAGSTANTISNTTAATGSAPKLKSLWAALPPQYDANANFAMSKGSEGAVRKLVDAQGRFLWPTSAGSGFASPGGATTVLGVRELEGRPVLNSQFLADGSAAQAGISVVIYGDFSNYIIAERAQVTTVILRERFADTDQTGIILFERVGGDVWNIDAFRLGGL